MGVQADTDPEPRPEPGRHAPAIFRRLLSAGAEAGAGQNVRQVVDALEYPDRPQDRSATGKPRPHVILNMTSTLDGRASIAGRSGAISDPADRELFHGLRSVVDAVMAGAGTVRVERYGQIIAGEASRRLRRERGLGEQPLACIVSGRLSLPPDTPLLGEPDAHVVILTASAASLPESAARVEYVRTSHEGRLDLARALVELSERFGVRTLLCEGGPHLNSQLLSAGLVDELFLSLAPKLAGDGQGGGEALRILAGVEFGHPVELELLGALESGSRLFLRYGVRASAPERVSRETMPSSSLAS
jgi:riboflavin-specific deaminase-like protein